MHQHFLMIKTLHWSFFLFTDVSHCITWENPPHAFLLLRFPLTVTLAWLPLLWTVGCRGNWARFLLTNSRFHFKPFCTNPWMFSRNVKCVDFCTQNNKLNCAWLTKKVEMQFCYPFMIEQSKYFHPVYSVNIITEFLCVGVVVFWVVCFFYISLD